MEPGARTLTRARAALVVIDMLRDFLEGPFAAPGASRVIAAVRPALERARALGWPVVFVCDAHAPDDAEFAVLGPHAIAGTRGAEIVDELSPAPGEPVVPKRRYSGFFETDLADILRRCAVDTVALCGVQTDCCVLHTAADAFFRGLHVVILEDAAAARTDEGHRRALAEAQRLYGAHIVTSDAFFRAPVAHG